MAYVEDFPQEDIPPDGEAMPAPQPAAILPAAILEMAVQVPNLADMLEPDRLGVIAHEALEEYELDRASMSDWLARMEKGLDLAKLVKTAKTYPFKDAANVKYPLVTTAALQFNAKSYPAIVPADNIVKPKVWGADPTGSKAARGSRICEHMSYQLTCTIEEWEEDTDKLLTMLPIVGTVIRKVWFDPAQQRIRCRLLTTGSFIVNDKVRSLADAPRLTEELMLYPSEIAERVASGLFRAIDYEGGDSEDKDAPQKFIEQHRRLDLDEDGTSEPYIVTVHVDSQQVARIVADFEMRDVTTGPDGKVTAIRRGSYFVAYHLLPSLDGGFWGTGFGLLLGDISETINGIINLMLDAGHMSSRGGGFIGSEFRIKGGSQQHKPGEYKMVSATGAAIRDSIVDLTFPGPDATLFQLLGLLIEAGKEVASIKDILMGDSGGKAMTATATQALIEQGMAQFTAAYKRIFRALRHEFKLIAKINAETVSPEEYNAFHDIVGPDGQPMMFDPRQEYTLGDMDIVPVADPGSVTKMQKLGKAQILGEMAQGGMVDPQAAGKRMLEAASIEDAEELAPKPNPVQQEMEQLGLVAARAEITLKMVAIEQALASIEKTETESLKNITDAEATGLGLGLQSAKLSLEAMRAQLEQSIAGIAGGMAGASGQPGGQQGVAPAGGPPAGAGNGGMVGGPGMAGGGQVGPAPY